LVSVKYGEVKVVVEPLIKAKKHVEVVIIPELFESRSTVGLVV
jgi:hypothetical protein